jgi:hypothetical protein
LPVLLWRRVPSAVSTLRAAGRRTQARSAGDSPSVLIHDTEYRTVSQRHGEERQSDRKRLAGLDPLEADISTV